MAIREILLLGNPILRMRCERIVDAREEMVQGVIGDLRDTLEDFRLKNGFGRGIAAPQVGVTIRVLFVEVMRPIVLINPRITKRSKTTITLWDDCFSFPNIMVKVRRSRNITVAYTDEHGAAATLDAADDLSELLQHEIDHLDGILAIDRAISSKHIILRSEYERMQAEQHKAHVL